MSETETLRLALDDPRWLGFVATRPEALAFHRPEWSALVSDCYGYEESFAIAVASQGEIVAGAPFVEVRRPLLGRSWISLPFADYVPPLGDRPELLADALEAVRAESGLKNVELHAPLAGVPRRSAGFRHTLALEYNADAVFSRFKRSQVQQPIRKQRERGQVEVTRAESREDLVDTFYGLHLATRRRLGTPVQPRRFFELLWARLIVPKLGFVLVARRKETPIAAAVFLSTNRTVIYKYSASSPEHWNLRPNNLLLWEAIRWACGAGFHTFDFGRSDAENVGLRTFKLGWASVEHALEYASMPTAQAPSGAAGRIQGVRAAVIRHSPPWVCRATGALLYKYAA
jgi:CelD/BcsL family acetyltransferase involved in cellulose biosynthesis